MNSRHSVAQSLMAIGAVAMVACGGATSSNDGTSGVEQGGSGGESSGGSAGSGGTPGTTGGSGGSPSGGGSGGTVSMGPLCGDEITGLRLVMTSGGGFVEETYRFTNPLGYTFAVVDGACRYFAGGDLRLGIHTGTLTDAEVAALSEEVGFRELGAWSAHSDESCPDAGALVIASHEGSASCSCGCDEDAPPGLSGAIDQMNVWAARLWEQGEPLETTVTFLAWPWPETPTQTVHDWPLTLDLAAVAVEAPWAADATGTTVTEPDGISALQALRSQVTVQAYGDGSICVAADSGDRFHVLVRDDLPEDIVAESQTLLR